MTPEEREWLQDNASQKDVQRRLDAIDVKVFLYQLTQAWKKRKEWIYED